MKQQTLFLMLGYPGAGKTTAAKTIQQLTDATLLSSDEIRAELFPNSKFTQEEHDQLYKVVDDRAKQLLTKGKSVIYDANLNRYKHRQDKYELCKSRHLKSILVWVQTDKSTAKQRASHESRQHLWPKNETPEQMFDRIADILEPPKASEPHITIDGTKITPEYIKSKLQIADIL